MKVFELWVDGANGGRNGTPGGWAAILKELDGGLMLAISGHDPSTSNNRMELMGVIRGLEAIGEERASVTVCTDSAYVKNAHTQGWIRLWDSNGWVSSKGDPVANQDLWRELIVLVSRHLVKWRKIKGHGHSVLNNKADEMAVQAKISGVGVTEIL